MIDNFLIYPTALLILFLAVTFTVGKTWGGTVTNLLFADRSLKLASTGLAINSHWFWAIAIFISPAVAYNWGIIGLLWFTIPNALSLVIVGMLANKFRKSHPDRFSFTEYVREKYGRSVSVLLYIMYTCIAFAGILLGFTAIFKFFSFLDIKNFIEPIYVVLFFGLITLLFSMKGGIRTSIFTGATQTILWLAFLSVMSFQILTSDLDFNLLTNGKNNLETVFNVPFLTGFAVSFLISILVGGTSHGMMWQKSCSIPRENIIPSFTIAACLFGIMCFMMGSLGLFAQASGLTINSAETSQMASILFLTGGAGLLVFGTLLIGQTATVVDSCLNYFSSINSIEWFGSDSVFFARVSMFTFFIIAWLLTWLELEVWTIFMLMSALRITMFIPIVSMVNQIEFNTRLSSIILLIGVVGAVYLSLYARLNQLPIFNMYSSVFAIIFGAGCMLVTYRYSKHKIKA
jgi:Na+/proline symporter